MSRVSKRIVRCQAWSSILDADHDRKQAGGSSNLQTHTTVSCVLQYLVVDERHNQLQPRRLSFRLPSQRIFCGVALDDPVAVQAED